jgi:hypothetical protein
LTALDFATSSDGCREVMAERAIGPLTLSDAVDTVA